MIAYLAYPPSQYVGLDQCYHAFVVHFIVLHPGSQVISLNYTGEDVRSVQFYCLLSTVSYLEGKCLKDNPTP